MKKNQTETKKENKPSLFEKRSLIFLLSVAVIAVIYVLITSSFAVCEKHISVITALLAVVICFGGAVLPAVQKNEKLNRFIKGTAAACLIAFASEVLVFNFKSIAKGNSETVVSDYTVFTTNNDITSITADEIVMSSESTLYYDIDKADINAVTIEFDSEGTSEFRIVASIKDNNFSQRYINIGEKRVKGDYGKADFSFKSYENLHSIRLEFYGLTDTITISKISFFKALPFRFSDLRFWTVFLILTLIALIRSYELYKVTYNRKDTRHRAIIFVLTCLSALTVFLFANPDVKDMEYTKGDNYYWADPYVQMFDAIQNKRVNINITPSDELLAMENPYDLSLREDNGVAYSWDRAYYDGKYYSYYGIAPVLTYYYPYYFITKRLPSINSACMVFGFLSIIFMYGTIMAFVRKYLSKPNFLTLILCMISSLFASGIYFNVNSSDMYALPGITGTCFLMMCLWCGIEACIHQGKKKQPVLFILCGLAFALCLASKPTRALSCLVIAPVFLELLFNREIKVKSKIISVASFLVPVGIGCGAIMAYNNARFDSPFEFGAIYQLTVSNVTASGLKISMLPDSIMNYFLRPLCMKGSFPFVSIDGLYLSNRQAYIYSDFSMGALAVPFIAAGLLVLPLLIHHNKAKKGEKFCFNAVNTRKMAYLLVFAMSVFIAWFDYCMAGVILSYVCDIFPLLALLAAFVICDVSCEFKPESEISAKSVSIVSIVTIITVMLGILELLSFDNNALNHAFPHLLYYAEDLVSFWN